MLLKNGFHVRAAEAIRKAVCKRPGLAIAFFLLVIELCFASRAGAQVVPPFEITFPAWARPTPLTALGILVISRRSDPEPVLQGDAQSCQLFAVSVSNLRPGQTAVIDTKTLGSPVFDLTKMPPGDYYAQAYT